jgi:CheY-like chemotaxis protein/HPt (histidine-containing phosphotransfer) domain-containing protein
MTEASNKRAETEAVVNQAMAEIDGRQPIVVLLVDDQQFISTVVGQLLASESDIEFHSCLQGSEAIAIANQINPTVVLQDLIMPDIDGLTLVGLFRANPSTADTPIIVLSGNDDAATRSRALAEGAADYLVKLPAKADLIACIRRQALHDAVGAAASPQSTASPRHAEETLDLGVLATFREAGPDFARRLIDRFIIEAESRVGALREAAALGNRDALKANAHALKGSSMTMGAKHLASLCAQVESDPASSAPEGVNSPLMTEIDGELNRVRDALAVQRQGSGPR